MFCLFLKSKIRKEWINFNTSALFKLLLWQVADMYELKESFFQVITSENFLIT